MGEEGERLSGSRIRDYITVLVEHTATDRPWLEDSGKTHESVARSTPTRSDFVVGVDLLPPSHG